LRDFQVPIVDDEYLKNSYPIVSTPDFSLKNFYGSVDHREFTGFQDSLYKNDNKPIKQQLSRLWSISGKSLKCNIEPSEGIDLLP